MIPNLLRHLRSSEDGAVTIDWVVLTAVVVLLAALVAPGIHSGSAGVATGINERLLAAPAGAVD